MKSCNNVLYAATLAVNPAKAGWRFFLIGGICISRKKLFQKSAKNKIKCIPLHSRSFSNIMMMSCENVVWLQLLPSTLRMQVGGFFTCIINPFCRQKPHLVRNSLKKCY